MFQTKCTCSTIPQRKPASQTADSTAPRSNRLRANPGSTTRLMLRAGMISNEHYWRAIDSAALIGKSTDEVISRSFANDRQMKLCSNALNYVARGIVGEELATQGLMMANAKGLSFVEGLKYFGFGW